MGVTVTASTDMAQMQVTDQSVLIWLRTVEPAVPVPAPRSLTTTA